MKARKLDILLLVLLSSLLGPGAMAQLRYDQEYPEIDYTNRKPSERVMLLQEAIDSGTYALQWQEGRGYLESLLEALEINPASQVLVFSKTALKARFVTAATPRAIYFNDDVYVGFIENTSGLEIASMDPLLGPVFFGLPQNPELDQEFEREFNRCLRCHDTYSLTGGGVPRFMMSTNLAGTDGAIISHEFSEITDTSTPLSRRWGGWYVTGMHGEQATMGNFVIADPGMLQKPDLLANGNKSSLAGIIESDPLAGPFSDIVALLVLEHQVEVQNAMVKASYNYRSAAANAVVANQYLAELAEPLVESLLMANEVELDFPISGRQEFTDYFQGLGPRDNEGRSLRDFDLQTRTFRYPLSYQIYSKAFDALPDAIRGYVFQRLAEILEEDPAEGKFNHLDIQTRGIIKDILLATKPEARAYFN